MISAGNRYITPILLSILLGGSACEKKCMDEVCAPDQDLQIVFIDSGNVNLIEAGLLTDSLIHVFSPANDTLVGDADTKKGSYNVRTNRDLGQYTLSVGTSTNVDLLVYQKLVPSDFECCPGYWRIDSVYARGSKLAEVPGKGGFYLKVE